MSQQDQIPQVRRSRSRSLTQEIKQATSGLTTTQQVAAAISIVGAGALTMFPGLSQIFWQIIAFFILGWSMVFQLSCICYSCGRKWHTILEYVSQWRHGEFSNLGVY